MYKLALALALGTAAAVDVTDVKAWHAANGGSDPKVCASACSDCSVSWYAARRDGSRR